MTDSVHSLAWQPLLPVELLIALLVVALLLTAMSVYQQARGWPLRLLATTCVFALLAGPVLQEEVREELPDLALILHDTSASHHFAARKEISTLAVEDLRQSLLALPSTEVRILEGGASQSERARGETRLYEQLQQALHDLPRNRIAGIFLISDGQLHDVPDLTLPEDVPLHHLLPGRKAEVDRRLTLINTPRFALLGKPVKLHLKLEDLGQPADGRKVPVRVLKDGEEIFKTEVSRGEETEITLTLDRRGPAAIELEAPSLPGEISEANNRAVAMISGVRERLRVLLLSGAPHQGERAWRNILKSDPSVDLVHFTILRPPDKQDGTPIRELALIAFPTRELFEQKLNDFDLVIFDRYRRHGVLPSLYLENISRYVEKGGALFVTTGPEYSETLSIFSSPLARTLPVEANGPSLEEPYQPRLSEAGKRHPITHDLQQSRSLQEDPDWGRWFRISRFTQTGGTNLMSGPSDLPLLLINEIGEGRSALLTSDQSWLWARGFEGGGPLPELVRRTAHWLMKEPELEANRLVATIRQGQLLAEAGHAERTEEPQVAEVVAPDGQIHQLPLTPDGSETTLSSLTGRMDAPLPGPWQVRYRNQMTYVQAGPAVSPELQDLRALPLDRSNLPKANRGGTIWLEELGVPRLRKIQAGRDNAGNNWLGLVKRQATRTEGLEQRSLLPDWLALLIICLLLLFCWRRESA